MTEGQAGGGILTAPTAGGSGALCSKLLGKMPVSSVHTLLRGPRVFHLRGGHAGAMLTLPGRGDRQKGAGSPVVSIKMEKLKVDYFVPRTVAIDCNVATYGRGSYELTDDDISSASNDVKEFLKTDFQPIVLKTAKVNWLEIAYGIVKALDEQRKRRETEKQLDESTIAAALAAPNDEWIHPYRNTVCPPHGCLRLIDDPRIAARVAELEPIAQIRRQLSDDESRRMSKAQEAKENAKKQAIVDALESIEQWCERPGNPLQRAVLEKYDVIDAALRLVANSLADSVGGAVSTEGTEEYDAWNFVERSAPSPEAFAAYDTMKKAIDELDKPKGITVQLKRVARVSIDDDNGENEQYTAIVAFVEGPREGDRSRAVIVRAE